uniref:26S proteasome non-ATPase regulatory subunit 1/RPN2 N-terminal domain-containing protein n=1 Tax=Globodera rostochiensis TaxID=31243 RepID=A0A914HY98_GLORO
MADVYLMQFWKQRIHAGNYTTAAPFLVKLGIRSTSDTEKYFITENLDDWSVITATWFEMARHIGTLQKLASTAEFSGRFKAALLCSKTHYCLEQYNLALEYALASGNEFQLVPHAEDFKGHDSLYVSTIIRQALDTYKHIRISHGTELSGLDVLVNRIFHQNLELKDYSLVAVSNEGGNTTTILMDTLNKLHKSHLNIEFQDQVLGLIYRFLEGQREPNYFAISQCLIKLGQSQSMAEILNRLIAQNVLMAYQLAFDLNENAPQEFLQQLKSHLFPVNPPVEDQNADANPQTLERENLERILGGEETIKHHMHSKIPRV